MTLVICPGCDGNRFIDRHGPQGPGGYMCEVCNGAGEVTPSVAAAGPMLPEWHGPHNGYVHHDCGGLVYSRATDDPTRDEYRCERCKATWTMEVTE